MKSFRTEFLLDDFKVLEVEIEGGHVELTLIETYKHLRSRNRIQTIILTKKEFGVLARVLMWAALSSTILDENIFLEGGVLTDDNRQKLADSDGDSG